MNGSKRSTTTIYNSGMSKVGCAVARCGEW